MIHPTIGRVILFKNNKEQEQAQPALVCYVHHDRMINVGGVDNQGYQFAQTSVVLLQDDDPIPESGSYAE
jgi:hypothetical protein